MNTSPRSPARLNRGPFRFRRFPRFAQNAPHQLQQRAMPPPPDWSDQLRAFLKGWKSGKDDYLGGEPLDTVRSHSAEILTAPTNSGMTARIASLLP